VRFIDDDRVLALAEPDNLVQHERKLLECRDDDPAALAA
jgi:hypothetical protein